MNRDEVAKKFNWKILILELEDLALRRLSVYMLWVNEQFEEINSILGEENNIRRENEDNVLMGVREISQTRAEVR